ncbi:MAG: hypothetical protein C0423_09160 [Methylibium sp.]|nr:hypothetical protein [Methylibium sp.]
MFEIYSEVVLSVTLPLLHVKSGAQGVVVHVHGAGEAYEVEFMSDDGQNIAVATVLADELMQSPAELHACLDGPDQESLPLPGPTVVERLRQDWAKRQRIYGEERLPSPGSTPQ